MIKLKGLAKHTQILLGMLLGLIIGAAASSIGAEQVIIDWVKPLGIIFINLLKMIAVPMIITSLIKGVTDLGDITQFSKMGLRTVTLYLITTVVAITLGLLCVNLLKPGNKITEETRSELVSTFQEDAGVKIAAAESQQKQSPLQPLIDLVPVNLFAATSVNRNMLQVIFSVLLFSIGLLLVEPKHQAPVKSLFDALHEIVLTVVNLIMAIAPIGVFALLAALVAEISNPDLLIGLLWYGMTVVVGLATMMFVFYPTLVVTMTDHTYLSFFKGISPAQLLAFSTSSSAATLPVTMERVEKHLGVKKEVSSFVLPVGATVNMDGTSLYQAVAAVFIAQAFGMELDLNQQLTIVLTATLASIGSAAVPGAGMVMLVIVLGAIGVPEQGLALIFAVDRILDMCRTSVNVTGDAAVCLLIGKKVG
ncbi:MAG: dicarboxylate/amino acid:cation symporter [Rubripirellula sp.]